jgi:hypothetical protein
MEEFFLIQGKYYIFSGGWQNANQRGGKIQRRALSAGY